MSKAISYRSLLVIFVLLVLSTGTAFAQTTEFTYQGSLKDGAIVANGNYDFEFALFDALAGGTQLGSTLTRNAVAVAGGIFSVKLDFGPVFPGANRYLEIRVRLSGQPGITTLGPRQLVNSAPYSVKTLNADNATNATNAATATNSLQLGGVAANQFVVTTDTRMSDARDPLPGSVRYVQNGTTPQSASSFNITGNGTVGGNLTVGGTFSLNIVNADTQYNISGSRVLTASSFFGNMFAGIGAGTANTTGGSNSFFGNQAGQSNVNGGNNSFFGKSAGNSNTGGGNNSFFGEQSGFGTATGGNNSFFGQFSGRNNITGSDNAFFGYRAGQNNTASGNSIFGSGAGDSNTSGGDNSFFGNQAGQSNVNGGNNSFFGKSAGNSNTGGNNNSFFGEQSGFGTSTGGNNSFFGQFSGRNNSTGTDNAFFGFRAGQNNTAPANSFFGSKAGESNTTGENNSFFGRQTGLLNTTGCCNSFVGEFAGFANTTGSANAFFGNAAGGSNTTGGYNTIIGFSADVGADNLTHATAIGAEAVVSLSNSIVLGRANGSDAVRIPGSVVIDGSLVVGTLGSANTSAQLCRNTADRISPCSSSLRYKTDVSTFSSGLDVVRRLRPITFNWKDGGMHDVGFAAEEVEKVEPLLTTYNNKGEIEGVKYAQITTVLVNAVKEQQKIIEQQQKQINALKRLVCEIKPEAEICKEKEEQK